MPFDLHKRDWEEAFNPWKREPKKAPKSVAMSILENWSPTDQKKFNIYPQNRHLDIYTKNAALTASQSVVGLESRSGEGAILQGSGFIIESSSTHSIILTAACLLKCSASQNSKVDDIKVTVHLPDGRCFDGEIEASDFRCNIAAIRIDTDALLPTVSLAQLNDAITVNPCQQNEESFRLHPQSNAFELVPGDLVVALGRFIKTYDIMAAPGFFSVDRCDRNELFRASCRITKCGIGGPLVNRYGQVIGICLHNYFYTAFLPINIVSIWWERCEKYRQPLQPWLGMEVTNLYAAPVQITERIIRKFPDIMKGVIVEEVVRGSSAELAGIKHNDVIIEFAGKRIHSVLELFENTWNKVGETVDLTVIRASDDVLLHFPMVVDEAKSG